MVNQFSQHGSRARRFTASRRGPASPGDAASPIAVAEADAQVADTAEAASAEQLETARGIVLRQLTASAKSRRQLEDKLAERDVPEHVAQEVLDRFEQVGLVDDREYAAMFVRSRAETRKLSRAALRRELSQRGITGELAEQALEQRHEEDEVRDAHELVRRKLPASADLTDRKERDKLTRRLVSMLGRKGYPSGMAFAVVKEELAGLGPTSDPGSEDGVGAEVWDTP